MQGNGTSKKKIFTKVSKINFCICMLGAIYLNLFISFQQISQYKIIIETALIYKQGDQLFLSCQTTQGSSNLFELP